MLNLDTHILVFALVDELKPKERRLLSGDTWSVSAIVLWELCKLVHLGRIDLDIDDAGFKRTLARIHTWPITFDICRTIRKLDFQSDPADELIAATSVVHEIPLVTRDSTIRRSRVVPIAK